MPLNKTVSARFFWLVTALALLRALHDCPPLPGSVIIILAGFVCCGVSVKQSEGII